MKTQMKTILLTLTVFFSVLTLQAQDKSAVGLKGGYNLAAVSYDGEGETGQRHSFHIGFYAESFLNDFVALQPELLYSEQGYEIKNSFGTYTQKLNYINLPVMLKAYPAENFFLEVGPQIGLAVSHKEEYKGSFTVISESDPDSFDWGVNFGGGFKTNSGISLGARYHLGMGDVYDEGSPKNRVWQFYIGFAL